MYLYRQWSTFQFKLLRRNVLHDKDNWKYLGHEAIQIMESNHSDLTTRARKFMTRLNEPYHNRRAQMATCYPRLLWYIDQT